jgi:hypothetical protein
MVFSRRIPSSALRAFRLCHMDRVVVVVAVEVAFVVAGSLLLSPLFSSSCFRKMLSEASFSLLDLDLDEGVGGSLLVLLDGCEAPFTCCLVTASKTLSGDLPFEDECFTALTRSVPAPFLVSVPFLVS